MIEGRSSPAYTHQIIHNPLPTTLSTDTYGSTFSRHQQTSAHRRLMQLAFGVRGFIPSLSTLSFIIAALVILQMFLLSRIIHDGFLKRGHLDEGPVYLLVLVILVRGILHWIREWLARKYSAGIRSSLRKRLFSQLICLGPAFTRTEKTGGIVATLTEGVDKTEDYFSKYIPSLIHIALLPAILIVFTLIFDWISGLIMLVTGPLILFFMWMIGTYAGQLTKKQWGSLSRMSSHFLDALQGLKTLKLFGANQRELNQVGTISNRFRQATMKVLQVAFLSGLVLELAASVSIALIAVQVGIRLIEGLMTFHPALFILLIAPEFYLPFRNLGAHHHAGMEGAAAAEKVFDLLEGQNVEQSNSQKVEQSESRKVEQSNSQKVEQSNSRTVEQSSNRTGEQSNSRTGEQSSNRTGEHLHISGESNAPFQLPPGESPNSNGKHPGITVEFSGVHFSYPGASRPALEGIDCKLNAGTTTALVGHTGSGKTTLANLLLAFIQPNKGQVLINGMDLQLIGAETWRSKVALVPQHPHFFTATVVDNLKMAHPGADMGCVMAAARDAGIHDVIESLPKGYHTLLRNNAARLSGGERQRLAIARAFLKNASFLILDEPTSNLDPRSEQIVSKAYRKLAHGRTTLIIAHRLQTVIEADQIVVFEQGRLVETGTHQSLLARNGVYASYLKTLDFEKGGVP